MNFRPLILLLSLIPTVTLAVPANKSENAKPYLIGYWQNFSNQAETSVRLTDIPSGYNIVNIAFADLASDGTVSFNLQGPPYDALPNGISVFKEDIKKLQTQGVKVLLSLGGQNAFYQVNDSTTEKRFVNSLEEIISTYGFDGLDYDFESGLSTANESYLIAATRQIQEDFAANGKTLFFTAAPETIDVYWQVFPNGKYDQLIQSGLLNVVNVQLYNSGCMSGSKDGSGCYVQGTENFIVSQADSTIQTWMKNGVQQPAVKYGIGLPATTSAANGGYVDPTILKKSLVCLQTQTECDTYVPTQVYPELNHMMTWDINWDAKNNYAFEKSIQNLK